jgi:hypothetical protein
VAGVFLGSEAIARGKLTRGQLRWNYRRIHSNVYLPKDAPRSLWDNIHAAWLWSGRRGIISGRAAAALHGAKWIDDFTPIELVGPLHHPPPGIIVRRERIGVEDLVEVRGLLVTNPARAPPSIWPGICRMPWRSPISTRCRQRPASPRRKSHRYSAATRARAASADVNRPSP